MTLRFAPTEVNGLAAIALESDLLRLIVVPELGGKIISLLSRRTGREWLWTNPHIPFSKPPEDATNFGLYDSGGWDEIFPTVNPCSIPESGWGDRHLTDHGELWYRPWQIINQRADAHAIELTLGVESDDLPFRFVRTLRLTSDTLEVDYQLTNIGNLTLPYLLAAHPLIAIEPGDQILLPADTMMSSTGFMNLDITKNNIPFRWPNLLLRSGEFLDLRHIPQHDANFAIKLFAENVSPRRVAILDRTKKECLSVSFSDSVSHCGLWLNYGAWSGAGTQPYFNLGLEPTNLPGDDLAIVGQLDSAMSLTPQDIHRWSIHIRFEECS